MGKKCKGQLWRFFEVSKLAGYVPWHTSVICARLQAQEMSRLLVIQFLPITSNQLLGFLELLAILCVDVILGKATEAHSIMAFEICARRQPLRHYPQGKAACTITLCKRRVDRYDITAGLDFGFMLSCYLKVIFAFGEHFCYQECDRSASGK